MNMTPCPSLLRTNPAPHLHRRVHVYHFGDGDALLEQVHTPSDTFFYRRSFDPHLERFEPSAQHVGNCLRYEVAVALAAAASSAELPLGAVLSATPPAKKRLRARQAVGGQQAGSRQAGSGQAGDGQAGGARKTEVPELSEHRKSAASEVQKKTKEDEADAQALHALTEKVERNREDVRARMEEEGELVKAIKSEMLTLLKK
ncbi:hypothetical protein T492DRAFT_840447 [Pavlovales sp. CCMP2436]|nr:hypothetical protein T492DRAFT_840447 [Pavlovales sp. CCMP2436]